MPTDAERPQSRQPSPATEDEVRSLGRAACTRSVTGWLPRDPAGRHRPLGCEEPGRQPLVEGIHTAGAGLWMPLPLGPRETQAAMQAEKLCGHWPARCSVAPGGTWSRSVSRTSQRRASTARQRSWSCVPRSSLPSSGSSVSASGGRRRRIAVDRRPRRGVRLSEGGRRCTTAGSTPTSPRR